jgi:hypothetical protein
MKNTLSDPTHERKLRYIRKVVSCGIFGKMAFPVCRLENSKLHYSNLYIVPASETKPLLRCHLQLVVMRLFLQSEPQHLSPATANPPMTPLATARMVNTQPHPTDLIRGSTTATPTAPIAHLVMFPAALAVEGLSGNMSTSSVLNVCTMHVCRKPSQNWNTSGTARWRCDAYLAIQP